MTPPKELIDALNSGEITIEQLRELIRCEADELGLTLDEAEAMAAAGTLPKGPLGIDIEYMLDMIEAAA